jgi:hypothetical protein
MKEFEIYWKMGLHHDELSSELSSNDLTTGEKRYLAELMSRAEKIVNGRTLTNDEVRLVISGFVSGVGYAAGTFGRVETEA